MILYIDTETTDLRHYKLQYNKNPIDILQLSILKAKKKGAKESSLLMNFYFKSDLENKGFSSNKIDSNNIENEVPITDKSYEFLKNMIFYDGNTIVGHNILGFDLPLLISILDIDVSKLNLKIVDTFMLHRELKVKGIVDKDQSLNLEELRKLYRLRKFTAHNAVEDCKMTEKVLNKYLKLYNKTLEDCTLTKEYICGLHNPNTRVWYYLGIPIKMGIKYMNTPPYFRNLVENIWKKTKEE